MRALTAALAATLIAQAATAEEFDDRIGCRWQVTSAMLSGGGQKAFLETARAVLGPGVAELVRRCSADQDDGACQDLFNKLVELCKEARLEF